MNYKCFLIKPIDKHRLWLRRYHNSTDDTKKCLLAHGYHDAMTLLGDFAAKLTPEGFCESVSVDVYADDPRWPVKCLCGYEFTILDDNDKWQVFQRRLYVREDNGAIMTIEDAPPGAMYDASWWMGDMYKTEDGKQPVVVLPGNHNWTIDGRASNCDSPCKNCNRPYHQHLREVLDCKEYIDARPHRCWIRHGEMPNLTVGKDGPTCGAGAGSIQVPGWHGFLRNGVLEEC